MDCRNHSLASADGSGRSKNKGAARRPYRPAWGDDQAAFWVSGAGLASTTFGADLPIAI
jgi:hypothetical protein